MKQEMYVIATRGRNNKEIYLAVDESKNTERIMFKWTEDIEEAYAAFTYSDVEDTARNYFKNFNKWYITTYKAIFN